MDDTSRDKLMRQLPVLLGFVCGTTTVATIGALLVLIFWGDPGQRSWLLMTCLGVAGAGVIALLAFRLRAPRLTLDEVFRHVLDRPAVEGYTPGPSPPLPATLPRERRRWAHALCYLGVASWSVSGFFLLSMADHAPPEETRELRAAGAVVETLPIVNEYLVDRKTFDTSRKHRTLYTQELEVRLPEPVGRVDTIGVRITSYSRYSAGESIRVLYAPTDLSLDAYAGPRNRNDLAGFTEGSAGDLDRILAGRALSATQLSFGGLAWLGTAAVATWLSCRPRSYPATMRLRGARALRGVFRSGRIEANGAAVAFSWLDPPATAVGPALEGRPVWLCWDPRRTRRYRTQGKGRPVISYTACPAVVIFDSGHAVYGEMTVLEPHRVDQLGMEVDGDRVPLDASRRVRIWTPRKIWPLTLKARHLWGYTVALVASGILFSPLVGGFYLRLAIAACGALALSVQLGFRFPAHPRPGYE
ncbi:hypothetical protein [Streptomyces otsuchiensis]|uniref:hypothetical protein n=1 Tax=Streptomyces otsuchiensis TaxID=2681388 RepID=UPI0010314413|nr:hypothetical protein [Streptomyces otsuchiensis]